METQTTQIIARLNDGKSIAISTTGGVIGTNTREGMCTFYEKETYDSNLGKKVIYFQVPIANISYIEFRH